jgi:polyhydroxyalkanoate synthesis regulator phasin
MVRDALRSYLSLATGLVDVPRQQAVRVAKALVSQGEATAEQAGAIADDLLGTSRANRDALLQLIRYEVDRGLGRLGLATADEVRDLTDRVHRLEGELRRLRDGAAASAGAPVKKAAPGKKAAPKKVAKKSAAAKKTAPAKAASANGVSGRDAAGNGAAARKAAPAAKAARREAAAENGNGTSRGAGADR